MVTVSAMTAPLTQVIVGPACRQVLAYAWALAGSRKVATTIEARFSKAAHVFNRSFFIPPGPQAEDPFLERKHCTKHRRLVAPLIAELTPIARSKRDGPGL